jgi:hypothetical protein
MKCATPFRIGCLLAFRIRFFPPFVCSEGCCLGLSFRMSRLYFFRVGFFSNVGAIEYVSIRVVAHWYPSFSACGPSPWPDRTHQRKIVDTDGSIVFVVKLSSSGKELIRWLPPFHWLIHACNRSRSNFAPDSSICLYSLSRPRFSFRSKVDSFPPSIPSPAHGVYLLFRKFLRRLNPGTWDWTRHAAMAIAAHRFRAHLTTTPAHHLPCTHIDTSPSSILFVTKKQLSKERNNPSSVICIRGQMETTDRENKNYTANPCKQ